ncbi:MAG: TatD family hydrolase [Anaerolineaceae bacterium]
MVSLSDTHCHLDLKQFDDDRQAVLERAWHSGIQRILIPQIQLDSSDQTIQLAESDERIFVAVGVHPNSADTWTNLSMRSLRQITTTPRVCAIGEIGLDYYREHTSHEQQQRILKEQLSLAAEVDKPVILHCRNAFEDLIKTLMEWIEGLPRTASRVRKCPGVFHSFGGDPEQAKTAVHAGFMLGINGSISFKKADRVRSVVQTIGIDCLLLETDAPFITPAPHRGERNEPAFIRHTNDALASVLGITPEHCAKMTYNNACKTLLW